jgi:hypothetical protein
MNKSESWNTRLSAATLKRPSTDRHHRSHNVQAYPLGDGGVPVRSSLEGEGIAMPSVGRGFAGGAKVALTSVAIQYAERAGIVVVFAIAAGFAIAAIATLLSEEFGSVVACWITASGLLVFGLAAGILIRAKERSDEARQQKVMKEGTKAIAKAIGTNAPLLVAGNLLSTHAGASAALSLARLLGRNLSLVALLAVVSGVLWPTSSAHFERGHNGRYLH